MLSVHASVKSEWTSAGFVSLDLTRKGRNSSSSSGCGRRLLKAESMRVHLYFVAMH